MIKAGSLSVPGGWRMRGLLILGGIGILSVAPWPVSADDGASWFGSKHPRPGHGGLEYHMRHGGGHFAIAGQLGMFFPTPPELFTWESEPGPALAWFKSWVFQVTVRTVPVPQPGTLGV